jgi:hypothetical protein
MMSAVRAVVLVGLAAALAPAAVAKECTGFGMEDEKPACPAALPADVAAILLKDEHVQRTLDGNKLPPDQLPLSWFAVSEVHLAGPREKDLVVMATGRLGGANVTTFWVFRPTEHGHELVLNGPALVLNIKKERANGYKMIELTKVVHLDTIDSVTLRFNGSRYEAFRQCEEKINGSF